MNMKLKKIKIEPRIKLNYNIHATALPMQWGFRGGEWG